MAWEARRHDRTACWMADLARRAHPQRWVGTDSPDLALLADMASGRSAVCCEDEDEGEGEGGPSEGLG